jgi:hypothetical protein
MKEMKSQSIARMSIAFIGILFCAPFFASSSGVEATSAKIVSSTHGPATVRGEDGGWYYYSARIASDAGTTVVFKENTCSLTAKDGKKYPKCWIHIAGASAGLSMQQQAGISMRTFGVELGDSPPSNVAQWSTSAVDTPEGSIAFVIPKGGYVALDFLWQVPQGFAPSRITIGSLVNLAVNK